MMIRWKKEEERIKDLYAVLANKPVHLGIQS